MNEASDVGSDSSPPEPAQPETPQAGPRWLQQPWIRYLGVFLAGMAVATVIVRTAGPGSTSAEIDAAIQAAVGQAEQAHEAALAEMEADLEARYDEGYSAGLEDAEPVEDRYDEGYEDGYAQALTDEEESGEDPSTEEGGDSGSAADSTMGDDCPAEPSERVGGEQAARCFIAAWQAGDDDLALVYGTPQAVEDIDTAAMGNHGTINPDTRWVFTECGPAFTESSSGASCFFEAHGADGYMLWAEMRLGGGPSVGNIVEGVGFTAH